ncbi:pectate lyase [Micromonospora sp. NPDC049051]|uniref:pectate lyase n=1 Tax=unclassified Micromonospora TaxID=2617518 RepID=UPI00371A01BB
MDAEPAPRSGAAGARGAGGRGDAGRRGPTAPVGRRRTARRAPMDNVTATSTKMLAGIDTNWGDTARFSRITILNDPNRTTRICVRYKGVPKVGGHPFRGGVRPRR